jgi:hypothetical protein
MTDVEMRRARKGASMKKTKTKPKVKAEKKALTAAAPVEASPSAAAPAAKSVAAVMEFGKDAKGNVAYCPPPEEFDTSKPMLKHLGGSRSDHWNQMLCNRVMNSGWFRETMSPDERGGQQTAILAFLAGVKPANVVEGMMAAQLYASHAASMECYRRKMASLDLSIFIALQRSMASLRLFSLSRRFFSLGEISSFKPKKSSLSFSSDLVIVPQAEAIPTSTTQGATSVPLAGGVAK